MFWWLPRLAFLLFVAAVVALLWFLDRSEREEQRNTLISDSLWLEQNLQFLFSHNEDLLSRLDPKRLHNAADFEADARALLANHSGLVQILWYRPDGSLRRAFPPVVATPVEGQARNLALHIQRRAYGPPFQGTDGLWQFEVNVPIFDQERLLGLVSTVYDVRKLLTESVPWWLAERYRIALTDASGQIIGERTRIDSVAPVEHYQVILDPPGHGLLLQASPYPAPRPLAGRLISAALVVLALLVLLSLWALRRHVQGRLNAESALQNEVAFRKAMEDSLQTGLRARDPEGRITYVNPAFCQMVGWPAEELVGRPPPMPYWAEEYLAETQTMFQQVMAGKAPTQGFEMKFKRKNGELFEALIHEAPLVDSHGHQVGWMGSVVDITERKRATERARQQEERLQANARLIAMGEMASSLAHELNQPLTAISGYTTGCRNLLAAATEDRQALDHALVKCQEQAQRAARILRRIYEFARRHEPKIETCDMTVLLGDAVSLLEADARRHRIRIEQRLDPDIPSIQGDPVLLAQSLLNLIKNGLEAMRQTPENQRTLEIDLRHEAEEIHITIADHGSGISAKEATQLFEPFYTTKNTGLGVGLNICRSVIEAHQGRLWFEPNPAGGTIFHLVLPVRRP